MSETLAVMKPVGQQGRWFADVSIPCCHDRWLHGTVYVDPFLGHTPELRSKAERYVAAIQLHGLVLMCGTKDGGKRADGLPKLRRDGYLGLWKVTDIDYEPSRGLAFRLVEQLMSFEEA